MVESPRVAPIPVVLHLRCVCSVVYIDPIVLLQDTGLDPGAESMYHIIKDIQFPCFFTVECSSEFGMRISMSRGPACNGYTQTNHSAGKRRVCRITTRYMIQEANIRSQRELPR